MSGKLSGKVAIITGATSGIGKATALLFADEGADVVITGRRVELGRRVENEIRQKGGRCVFVQADHSQAEDCSRVVERTLAEFGRVDMLFNNAGIVTKGTAETTEETIWNDTISINITAVWRMCKLVIPVMKQQGGGVIVSVRRPQAVAGHIGRALERMGLLAHDAESAWLDLSPMEDTDAMGQLIGSSVTYRIAVGPQVGRKALVLRRITPLAGEDRASERLAKANGFSPG